jgi:hypothetical protein
MPHVLITVEESIAMAQIRSLPADDRGTETEKRLWRELRREVRTFFETDSGFTNPVADE